MQRVSEPLFASILWRSARVPSGRPSCLSKIASIVFVTSSDFVANGLMVDSMRASTVGGYVRCVTVGNDNMSSFAILMNSTVSGLPVSSVAFAPAAL